ELNRMMRPIAFRISGRLLPPAAFFENVGPPIAIHISYTQAVRETCIPGVGGNGVKLPLLSGIFWNRRESEHAAGMKNQLGSSIAGEVRELRRFVIDFGVNQMSRPMPR